MIEVKAISNWHFKRDGGFTPWHHTILQLCCYVALARLQGMDIREIGVLSFYTMELKRFDVSGWNQNLFLHMLMENYFGKYLL